jgi:putative ABC transport system permease protein
MLEEHLKPLKSFAIVLPTIFLLVAAFLVNIVLSRIVATQREQIGLLKAFGYGSGRVGLHYLELTLLIALPGIVLGLPFGAWLGRIFTNFYATFFRFPVLIFRIDPWVVVAASLVAIVAASGGALGAVRRVVALPPTVAMAPEIPAFHRSLLDALGLSRLFAVASRMVVRNVSQRPLRSALAVAGMSLAIAVVMMGSSFADSADRMRDVRYQVEEREDVTVSFAHARALGTVQEFRNLPGVTCAEPFRVVPSRLLARGREHDILLLGLSAGGVLRSAADNALHVVPIPSEGAVATTWLAKQFGLHRGDLLSLEIRENRRRVVETRLLDVVDEPLGAAVYMDLGALGRLLGEPATYSSASLVVDPVHESELYAVLKRTPAAAAVEFRRGDLASFRAMGDTAIEFVRKVEVVFAVIIAFGVVYNTAKIALAERARELATLRVLGFTRGEVSRILLGEIGVLALPSIPLGFAMGYWLSGLLIAVLAGDRMHPPHLVYGSTYAFSLAVFALAALGSALVVRRGLDRLDLLAVLKARE